MSTNISLNIPANWNGPALKKALEDKLKAMPPKPEYDNSANAAAIRAIAANGGNAAGYGTPVAPGTKALGRVAAPLAISQADAKALHKAVQHKQQFATDVKSAATVSDLLPPQLQGGIVTQQFETRLLDHLPVMSISAPSLEYLKFNSVTGSPAVVAEGASKPELTLDYTSATVTPKKIAAWTSATREAMSDYEAFTSYLQTELMHRIVEVENDELLNQTGTAGHIDGLIHQAGLSHARPATLTGGYSTETSLDALELAIASMRAGSELCSPDLFVVSPTTWSAIRRRKDAQQRYLFATADATAEAVNTIWGTPVLVTTDIPDGTGLFINNGFGFVVLRESLNVTTDPFSQSTSNVTLFIGEERIGLAVERPNRLLKVTNLGTDSTDA